MSAPAIRRNAARGLETARFRLRIALNRSTDSASRHAGHKADHTVRREQGFADLP